MNNKFTTRRRVQWNNTDAGGIMHFASFFTMMEESEHELLRSLGLSVSTVRSDISISFPRVSTGCDFSKPLRFEDEVDIDVTIARLGEKSVKYEFRFRRNAQEVAVGYITCVCCRMDGPEPKAIPIPDDILDKLRPLTS